MLMATDKKNYNYITSNTPKLM